MADRVIIVGTRRSRQLVTSQELAQMAGRAGRSHTTLRAFVDVITGSSDLEIVKSELENPTSWDVISTMCGIDEMSFHLFLTVTL